jgi:hypothetical protein
MHVPLVSKTLLRNVVFLIVLSSSFFTLPLRLVQAGTVVVYIPCFDFAISSIASCISTGLCVDSEGVTFIEIFPTIGNTCSASPVFNEAIGDISFRGDGLSGQVLATVVTNNEIMSAHSNTRTCENIVKDVFDFSNPEACIDAPPFLIGDGGDPTIPCPTCLGKPCSNRYPR